MTSWTDVIFVALFSTFCIRMNHHVASFGFHGRVLPSALGERSAVLAPPVAFVTPDHAQGMVRTSSAIFGRRLTLIAVSLQSVNKAAKEARARDFMEITGSSYVSYVDLTR